MITIIKYIIKDFYLFLKHPIKDQNKKIGFLYYLLVFGLITIVSHILRIGIPLLFSIFDVPVIYNAPSAEQIKPMSFCWMFLFGAILAPLFEELSFRYPLKYSRNSLFIASVSFIIAIYFTGQYAANKLLQTTDFNFSKLNHELLWCTALAILIFIITRFNKINKLLFRFWDKYLIIIIYLSAVYFAYIHFPLPKSGINWLWLPILVVPQFFMALYFSYIRLRVSFRYCIFLHMILNGVVLLPQFFIK